MLDPVCEGVMPALEQQIRNARALAPVNRLFVRGRLKVLNAFRFARCPIEQRIAVGCAGSAVQEQGGTTVR